MVAAWEIDQTEVEELEGLTHTDRLLLADSQVRASADVIARSTHSRATNRSGIVPPLVGD